MSCVSGNITKWASYLVHCHRFIRTNPDKEMTEVNTLQMINDWLKMMPTEFSTEEDEFDNDGDLGLSGTDVLFSALCYMECAASVKVRNRYLDDSIVDLIVDVTIMACRHDPIKQKKPIDTDYVSNLFQRVSSFISRYGCIPVELLKKGVRFRYPIEGKETAYRNLIELPHFSKWMKQKQTRAPDTYKELEEIELIEKMKKIEIEAKLLLKEAGNEDENEKKYKHIFQIDEVEQENGYTDSDSDSDDDNQEITNKGVKDASILKSSFSAVTSSSSSSNTNSNPIKARLEKKMMKRINKSPMNKPDTVVPGANRGEMWLIDRQTISSKFINFFNHIFYGAFMESKVLFNCKIKEHKYDCNTPEIRNRFFTWLEEHCSIDTNDDFMPRFRSISQERILPMGIRSRRFRREATASNWEQGMEILQDYLGMQCSTILHDIVYSKKMDVVKDREHPCFESLCITMFGYMLQHSCRDKSVKFTGKLYIQPTDLDEERQKWLSETRLYGYPRPPVIMEILNRYFVNISIYNESIKDMEIVIFECKDMIHAILSWVYYLHHEYDSHLRFEIPVDMSEWYTTFFTPPKPPINFSDMFKD